jgi:hypothetical protein
MNFRRKAPASVAVAVAAAFLAQSCGGRESVASRSAAAYDEATKKGIDVAGGHEHGGHAASPTDTHTESVQTSVIDHSAMQGEQTSRMDHSQMQGGQMSAMDHSQMRGGQMSGMDHSQMQSDQMSGIDHSRMRSGQMSGMDHSQMQSGAPTEHSATQHGTSPPSGGGQVQSSMSSMDHAGMQHGTAAPPAAPPPATTAAVAGLNPSRTLTTDSFDAPAPISVAEAVKAANNVPDGEIRHVVPGQDRENPPTPQPAVRDRRGDGQAASRPAAEGAAGHGDHGGAGSSAPPAAPATGVYTCPAHPEVTAAKPGTCPKCGRALVEKK